MVDEMGMRVGSLTGCAEEQQRCAQLLSKFPGQVQRDAPEVGIPQQVVEIVREQFEHQAKVVPPHKMPFKSHCGGEKGALVTRTEVL